MPNAIRFYDRVAARMSRRELLNVAWKLGAAAILQPLASATAFAQPIFRSYPFAPGVVAPRIQGDRHQPPNVSPHQRLDRPCRAPQHLAGRH